MTIALLGLLPLAPACSKDDECADDACDTYVGGGKDAPIAQDLAPFPGEGPTFTAVTATGYTVSWTAASDQNTSAGKLEYKLVIGGTSEDIDTLGEALNLPDAATVMNWTAGALSKAVADTSGQAPYYAVLVRDEVKNVALYPPQPVLGAGPAVGTSPTFSAITETGFTVSWGAGLSASSAPENLEYRVVRASTPTEIDTIAEVEASTSVILDWTKNVTTARVTGLTGNTLVYVAVLVRDESGHTSMYKPQSVKTGAYRLIFKTNTQFSSTHLSSSANADSLCNADSAKPPGRGTFKALISTIDRIACTSTNCTGSGTAEHTNWVMEANRTYESVLGEVLWTTNAAGIVTVSTHAPIYVSSNQFVWTGIDSGWVKAANTCSDWSTTSSGLYGRVGTADGINEATWNSFHQTCDHFAAIYCVEQ